LGQSVLLHEAIVFVAIITAIILQGILGVLIVVPLLASMIIIGRYVRRRLLGLPPFDEAEPKGGMVEHSIENTKPGPQHISESHKSPPK
jgi:hypothetical protein